MWGRLYSMEKRLIVVTAVAVAVIAASGTIASTVPRLWSFVTDIVTIYVLIRFLLSWLKETDVYRRLIR